MEHGGGVTVRASSVRGTVHGEVVNLGCEMIKLIVGRVGKWVFRIGVRKGLGIGYHDGE